LQTHRLYDAVKPPVKLPRLETNRVTFLHTYFSFDHRRMLCLYAGPDAEAVRCAQATAKMPFDRVRVAGLYLPDGEAP
jgi:hypothetical protein